MTTVKQKARLWLRNGFSAKASPVFSVGSDAVVLEAMRLLSRRDALTERLQFISDELRPLAAYVLLVERTDSLLNVTSVRRLARAVESGDRTATMVLRHWRSWTREYTHRIERVECMIDRAIAEVAGDVVC